MRFKKGYFIGSASLAVVALACSVISVNANPNKGHIGRGHHNNGDANVIFVNNTCSLDASMNQSANIPNFIPSTEGNIQGNIMTLEEPIISENTSAQIPPQESINQENINQENVQIPEESTGSNETNNQCNGDESTGTTNNSANTGCTGNIIGMSKDVDQSVILYEKNLLDSENTSNNSTNNSLNGNNGCTIFENTSNNTETSTTTENNTCVNNVTGTGATNPNARVETTEEVKENMKETTNTNCSEINKITDTSKNETNKSTNNVTTKKNTSNQVSSSTSKSTSQVSKNVSKSADSTKTDVADAKVLTGSPSDTDATEVDAEDDTSAEVVEESVSLPISEEKESIKKDREAPKTADKLKVAIVVLLLVVAIGIIIMLCIMNRNEVSKEEIKGGFGTNTATN